MTSNLPTLLRPSKGKLEMAAQELISRPGAILKNGILRKKGGKINFGRWPHKFVVLMNDSIFVYDNETSKSPRSIYSLEGYNRIARSEIRGQDWCFSIFPAKSTESKKIKTFACVSDADRKAWMRVIKKQIYTANNISEPVLTIYDQIKLMTVSNDEDDYVEIERVVYSTKDDEAGLQVLDHDKEEDYDSESSWQSDYEEPEPVYKRTRSQSLPINSFVEDTKRPNDSPLCRKFSVVSGHPTIPEHGKFCDSSRIGTMSTVQHFKNRLTSDPLPEIHSTSSERLSDERFRSDTTSTQSRPPRYSEVMFGSNEQELSDQHPYANLPKYDDEDNKLPEDPSIQSLESMSSITDVYFDREQLIAKLKSKKEPGTYLIRKSRTDNCKVIAFLNTNGEVVELKILGTHGQLTIDNNSQFTSIEKLLQFYTSVQPLPKINAFLRRGFHQVK